MARLIDADALWKEVEPYGLHKGCILGKHGGLADILMDIIEKQPTISLAKQEWISVKDKLPERTLPPHDVLVYHDLNCGMFVDRAWYSYDMGKWCSVLGMKLKVTHWMPLPEPPKEL